MTRRSFAAAPADPPLARLVLAWAVTRPGRLLFPLGLFVAAYWSLTL
ncbi:hypothetical protein [Brevundimonas diminuta]